MSCRLAWPKPLTDEDDRIWLRVENRAQCWIWNLSHVSDRRDADLTFTREAFRQHCVDLRAPCMSPRVWWLLFVKPGQV